MNDIEKDRVGPKQNPPHLGELIRESMDDVGWMPIGGLRLLTLTVDQFMEGSSNIQHHSDLTVDGPSGRVRRRRIRGQPATSRSRRLGAARLDRLAGPVHLVRREFVHDHDVAWPEGRRQQLLHVRSAEFLQDRRRGHQPKTLIRTDQTLIAARSVRLLSDGKV